MTLKERMEANLLYCDGSNSELAVERMRCLELLYDFNSSRPSEDVKRKNIIKDLFGSVCGDSFHIEAPFHCSYGFRIHIGRDFFANYNLVIIDDIDVYIGDYVMIAPNVMISTTGHPVHPDLRLNGGQFSKSVRIGNHVWLGAGVNIMPGVQIGDNSVIGAGSVVTSDIPADTVAFGNPCRVHRAISAADKIKFAEK